MRSRKAQGGGGETVAGLMRVPGDAKTRDIIDPSWVGLGVHMNVRKI
jgi:hypothetical protein